jgi:glycerol uptake operon antiterminator
MTASPRQPQHLIAAVRSQDDLDKVVTTGIQNVFILSSDLCQLEDQCRTLHRAGKNVFLHLDLIDGLKGDASGIRFARRHFQITGIISTKTHCVKLAKVAGLLAILRVFILDSSALKTGAQHAQLCRPDFVEVLPGLSPKIIRLARQTFTVPLIAGGLIQEKDDVAEAIAAGAAAVSTSNWDLWENPDFQA